MRRASKTHFDLFCVVLFIAMNNRVRDRFADGHINAKSRLVRDTTIAREVSRRSGSISDSLNVAGQNESSRLFGHKRRGLPAMGFAVCLLTIQKQNGDGRVTRRYGACQCPTCFSWSQRRERILLANSDKLKLAEH